MALLHFAKHAHEQHIVAGVFLGRVGEKNQDIVEAVPLVHTWALTPTITLGVAMATEYANTKNLEVVGFYAKTAAVVKNLLTSFSWVGRGKGVGVALDKDTGNLKLIEGQAKIAETIDEIKMKTRIKDGTFMNIVDLDDHLENPKLDFLNRE